jgi:Tol biopolymer transport system component
MVLFPINRKSYLVFAGIILLALVSFCVDTTAKGKPMLSGFSMSPDGKTVAFNYCEGMSERCRLGLLNLATERIVYIPGTDGKFLAQPSFSSDGRRLAAIMGQPTSGQGSHVVVIDLATLEITQLTEGRANRGNPVFQPGTGKILYVEADAVGANLPWFNFRLHNISERTETTILEVKDGFRVGIMRPSFLSPNEIVFGAYTPNEPGLSAAVKQLTGSIHTKIAFRLSFGGRPEIFLPHIEARRKGYYEPGISSISASKNGKDVVLVHLSLVEPRTKGVGYNYELFKLENGELKALTNLKSILLSAQVSLDGSTVAFGSDPKRRREWDLFVLDMKTGSVWETRLLDRLAKHPDFAPSK